MEEEEDGTAAEGTIAKGSIGTCASLAAPGTVEAPNASKLSKPPPLVLGIIEALAGADGFTGAGDKTTVCAENGSIGVAFAAP
jgi:hypothetical protein